MSGNSFHIDQKLAQCGLTAVKGSLLATDHRHFSQSVQSANFGTVLNTMLPHYETGLFPNTSLTLTYFSKMYIQRAEDCDAMFSEEASAPSTELEHDDFLNSECQRSRSGKAR